MSNTRLLRWRAIPKVLALGLLMAGSQPAPAAPQNHADHMQARALASFRAGRFPEAYGRFVELANLGHPPAARYALLMCEHGPDLFNKQWDCAQQEIADWAAAAGVAPFRLDLRVRSHSVVATRPARR